MSISHNQIDVGGSSSAQIYELAPTSLDGNWTCGDPNADARMGMLVKGYLMSHSS